MSLFHRQTKPTVSIFTTSEGHLSIAQAAESALKKNQYKTHFNLGKGTELNFYTPFYLFFPQLFKIPFQLSSFKTTHRIIHGYSKLAYQKQTSSALKSQKPQAVLSCFYMYNHLLYKTNFNQINQPFLFLNIITDPRSISPLIPSPHAINFVFDQKAVDICLSYNIPKEKIINSGWFVRDQFEEEYQKEKVRKQLKLDPKTLTLLVVTGSEGTNSIIKNFPAFINTKQPVQVIFACGKNQTLLKTITTLSKAIRTAHPKNKTKITTLPFTKNIHLYLQAADLIIGKAGPNLLFESVATHTPFLATTHISGQEDGNLDIIKEYRLGYVEENITKSTKLIKHLIQNPQTLNSFTPHLKKLAQKNSKSKEILTNTIKKNLKTSP